MMPTFSIIVPVYNAQRYLRECLDSIIAQVFVDFECICVDDGSTDGSAGILDEYATRDARFRVVHQENGGEGVARNTGLHVARGAVIAWVDADDLVDSGVLMEVQTIFRQNAVDMIRVRHKRFEGDTCRLVRGQCHEIERVRGTSAVQKWAMRTLVRGGYCWVTFIHKRMFSRMFPVGIQYAGDALFTLANVAKLGCVVQSEYIGYYYRDTPGSIMKKPFPSVERLRFFREFKEVSRLYEEHHPQLSWLAWINLVNWCMRPKDVDHASELHGLFKEFVKSRVVSGWDLPVYVRLSFVLYVLFGWRWQIVITYKALSLMVNARDKFRSNNAD